jgi:hypothetical protein
VGSDGHAAPPEFWRCRTIGPPIYYSNTGATDISE